MATKQEITDLALENFRKGYSCAQATLLAFSQITGLDEKTASLISSAFGGGMGRTKGKCGVLSASFMVLGMAEGPAKPEESEKKAALYQRVRYLNKMAEEQFGVVNCHELLTKYPDGDEPRLSPYNKNICVRFMTYTVGSLYDMLCSADKNNG